MLKYIEVLRALEYVQLQGFLSREEALAILRDLKNSTLPGEGFEGAERATVTILRKKFADAMELLREDSPDHRGKASQDAEAEKEQAPSPVLEPEDAGLRVEPHVAQSRPARVAKNKGSRKKESRQA